MREPGLLMQVIYEYIEYKFCFKHFFINGQFVTTFKIWIYAILYIHKHQFDTILDRYDTFIQ